MSLVDREEEKIINENNLEVVYEKPKKSIFSYIKIIIISIIVLFIGGIILQGMYQGTKTIKVDNPTSSGITIQFNNQEEIYIEAFTKKILDLDNGEYSLKVNNVDMGMFIKEGVGSKNFLNPTNDIYIQEYIVYGDENSYDKLPNNIINAYGNEAEGPFKKYEGLYISGDWNYDIDENYPDEVTMRKSQTYKIKSKLYRFDDFVDMYNSLYIVEGIE